MKQSQAVKHLRVMMTTIQKMRSTMLGTDTDRALLNNLMKWVFDDVYCPLPTLADMIGRAEAGKYLSPQDFYNMMSIATVVEPAINIASGSPLPKPDFRWILDKWEPEDAEKSSRAEDTHPA